MTIACYLEPTKLKAAKWMEAFAWGCHGHIVKNGKCDPDADDHVIMGNWPVATKLIAEFKPAGTPFWFLDSAYIRGKPRPSYLRVERGRFWPEFGEPRSMDRAHELGVEIQPWRYDGSYVLVCLSSLRFGTPWSIDIAQWNETIVERIGAVTDRPIVVRPKPTNPAQVLTAPHLTTQLGEAWCVVTHSSTIGVMAALAGTPVFCEPTCAAATVGCTDLSQIETPLRPDREEWIAKLAWRQWSMSEMMSGEAWDYLREAEHR